MKIYLLYYDKDTGSREEWSVFYTPCEAFKNEAERNVRKRVLQSTEPELEFHFDTLEMEDK